MLTRLSGMILGLVLAMATTASGAMMSGPADLELQTAITHAGLAARQNAVAQIELHLHHVINCIEGKEGKNYFAGSGDVCQGMGRHRPSGTGICRHYPSTKGEGHTRPSGRGPGQPQAGDSPLAPEWAGYTEPGRLVSQVRLPLQRRAIS